MWSVDFDKSLMFVRWNFFLPAAIIVNVRSEDSRLWLLSCETSGDQVFRALMCRANTVSQCVFCVCVCVCVCRVVGEMRWNNKLCLEPLLFPSGTSENVRLSLPVLTCADFVSCVKATLCNFGREPSHETTILEKTGHILQRKCPLVFPLLSYDCSAHLQPFILAELSPATTQCCSCCFSRQEAYMLLSGTSVNHRVEAEQS